MGKGIPRNEVRMIVSQRTETGIQTSETGHEMGEQWENYWRNTNWGKRFYRDENRDYWGVGKQMMNHDGVLTRTLKTMRDLETKKKTAPHITDAFHLCSDVAALCSHMYFIRYPQHSMNHRKQFSLSVTSETVFNFRTLCCPLGFPSAKSGEF